MTRLGVITLLLLACWMAATMAVDTRSQAQITENNIFASEFFKAVAEEKPNDNVVLSPTSIQSSLVLAFYGAKGKTATELQSALHLRSSDREQVVNTFSDYQNQFMRDPNLKLYNGIFINEKLEFKGAYQSIAKSKFATNVEKADFHPPYNKRTAERINKNVQEQTHNKVAHILMPEQLNDLTEGVIVNAVAYKSPWRTAFLLSKTEQRQFHTAGRASVRVDMMWTYADFNYAEVSSLDAKVVELPLQQDDAAMIIMLPNKRDGLQDLEQRLAGKDVLELLRGAYTEKKVEVRLPKFSVAFRTDLQEPLKKLGVTTMFTREGDFSELYRMFVSHYINSATHKAYLEVDEIGQEPPKDESSGKWNILNRKKVFEANHPFMFVVRLRNSIIMMGHIANYAYV